jgi:hypothetical protein
MRPAVIHTAPAANTAGAPRRASSHSPAPPAASQITKAVKNGLDDNSAPASRSTRMVEWSALRAYIGNAGR